MACTLPASIPSVVTLNPPSRHRQELSTHASGIAEVVHATEVHLVRLREAKLNLVAVMLRSR